MSINIRRKYNHKSSASNLLDRFAAMIQTDSKHVWIQIAGNLITLKVKPEQARWWSPELNLRIESEDDTTVLYELVGPNPGTFTFAMFSLLLGAVVFIAALIMMLAQIQLGLSSTLAIIGTLASVVTIISVLLILALGRWKAKEQVKSLRDFAAKIMGPS